MSESDTLSFAPIEDLREDFRVVDPDGVLDSSAWPPEALINLNPLASMVAVGPKVALSAAHVFWKPDKILLPKIGGVTGSCDLHPDYMELRKECSACTGSCSHCDPDAQAAVDVAICSSSEWDLEPVAVSLDAYIDKGDTLVLSGFGCTECKGVVALDLEFSYGKATVYSTNGVGKTKGGSALCASDSGGGVYQLSKDTKGKVVGIGSGLIDCKNRTSRVALLGHALNRKWIEAWADEHEEILGVNLD